MREMSSQGKESNQGRGGDVKTLERVGNGRGGRVIGNGGLLGVGGEEREGGGHRVMIDLHYHFPVQLHAGVQTCCTGS